MHRSIPSAAVASLLVFTACNGTFTDEPEPAFHGDLGETGAPERASDDGGVDSGVMPPAFFEAALHHVEYAEEDTAVELRAYDELGEVIGVIRVLADGGELLVIQEYDDGFASVTITPDGIGTSESTLDPSVLESRALAIQAHLDASGPLERNSWMKCGKRVAATAVACGAAAAFLCVGGAIGVGCACVPMIIREYRNMECPWE